jgi:hypothetical protein
MKAAEFVVAALIGIAAGLIAGYLMFSMAWKYVSVSMWFQSNKVWSGDWMIWAAAGAIIAIGLTYLFRSRKISN